MEMKLKHRLLSMVLSLLMVLSLIPATVFAADESANVAKIGETEYATIAEAVGKAKDGDTITLLNDVNLGSSSVRFYNLEDASVSNLTFDLGGHTITSSGSRTVEASRCVVVKNGTIANTSTSSTSMAVAVNFSTSDYTHSFILENATVTSTKGAGLKITTANGEGTAIIKDGASISGSEGIYVYGPTTQNANGKIELIVEGGTIVGTSSGLRISSPSPKSPNASIIVNITGGDISGTSYGIRTSSDTTAPDTTINITGGTISSNKTAVSHIQNGTLTISGSTVINGKVITSTGTTEITGGTVNGNVTQSGTGVVSISGGKFDRAFDTAFLAEGYIYDASTGTVKSEFAAKIGDEKYETLDAAIAAVKDGETIVLSAGEYKLNGSLTYNDKAFTIKADDNAAVSFDMSAAVALHGAKITFEGVTFNYGQDDYVGLQHTDTLVYNNCTINGKAFLYANSETFNNCKFVQTAEDYNLWTYGAKNVVFNGCTFDCHGKAVNVYIEANNASSEAVSIEVNNVTVNSTKENKAFLNIKNKTQAYEVTLSGENKVTGLAKNEKTGSELYQVEATEITETSGKTVKVQEKTADGTLTTIFEVKVPSNAAAKIGETEYKTLAEAVKAANAGDTIILLNDIELTSAQSITKQLTIDLNGKTLSGKASYTISIGTNGDLTVKDSVGGGKVANTFAGSATTIYLSKNNAAFTLESGTIESTPNITNLNSIAIESATGKTCEININGGSVVVPEAATNGRSIVARNGMTLNISGGTIAGGLHGVDAYGGSTVSITGGEISATYVDTGAINEAYGVRLTGAANLTIAGGTVTGVKMDSSGTDLPNVTLESGKVNGSFYSIIQSYKPQPVFTVAEDANIVLANDTAANFLPDTVKLTRNADGTYSINKVTYVAEIGGKKYETLAEAIDAANEGDTIILLDNVTVDALSLSKGVTIKSAEGELYEIKGLKSISGTGVTLENVYLNLTSTLEIGGTNTTLTNCTIRAKDLGYWDIADGDYTEAFGYNTGASYLTKVTGTNVTLTDCIFDGTSNDETDAYFPNMLLAPVTGTDVTMIRCTFNEGFAACYYSMPHGTWTLDGCKFTNIYCYNIQAGDTSANIVVKNCELAGWTSFGDAMESVSFENCKFAKSSGYATIVAYKDVTFTNCTFTEHYKDNLYIEDNTTVELNDCKVVDTDGNVSTTVSIADIAIIDEDNEDKTTSLAAIDATKDENGKYTGGTFVGDESAITARVADGHIPVENADGTYYVKPGAYVAEVNGKKYETLAEAVEAAKDGDTITLIADIDLDEQIAIGKAITIDGQSKYTIKATKKLVGTTKKSGMFYRTTSAQGTLTFLNVTLDGNGVSKIFLNEGGAGETVFDGVTSTNGGGISYGSGIHISGGGSHATIKNSTLTGSTGTLELNETNYYAANDLWVGGNVYVTVENSTIGYVFVNSAPTATAINGVVHGQLTITGENTKITYLSGEEENDATIVDKFGNNGSLVTIEAGSVDTIVDKGSYAISGGTFKTEIKSEWCADGFKPVKNADDTYTVKAANVTITVTSIPDKIATLIGGGKYVTGEEVTLIAPEVSGYSFDGWYSGNNLISKEMTYVVTAGKANSVTEYVAIYKGTGTKKLSVNLGKGEADYTYDGESGTWYDDITNNEFANGAKFTVTAKPFAGYTFLYWINDEGKIVSDTVDYEFYLVSDMQLTACYRRTTSSDNLCYVIFRDIDNRVLWSGNIVSGESVAIPAHKNYTGYKFVGWALEPNGEVEYKQENGTIKITAATTFYAKYESVRDCALTVAGGTADANTYKYGQLVTVKAEPTSGDKFFSGWYIGETLVSYDLEYMFYITDDTYLTAKYDGDAEVVKKPILNATMSEKTIENNRPTVTITVTWDVPEDYTIMQGGLLRAFSMTPMSNGDITLEKVNDKEIKRNTSIKTNDKVTYSYTLRWSEGSLYDVYAVGYIIYRNNTTGELITQYTDVVTYPSN